MAFWIGAIGIILIIMFCPRSDFDRMRDKCADLTYKAINYPTDISEQEEISLQGCRNFRGGS